MALIIDSLIDIDTLDNIAAKLQISLDVLKSYAQDGADVPSDILIQIMEITGLEPYKIDSEFNAVISEQKLFSDKITKINSEDVLGKIQRSEKGDRLRKVVKKTRRNSQQELDAFWMEFFTQDNILSILNEKTLYNTPNTRKYLNAVISECIRDFLNNDITPKTEGIFEEFNQYILMYPYSEWIIGVVETRNDTTVNDVTGNRIKVPVIKAFETVRNRLIVDVLTGGLSEVFFSGKSVFDWKRELAKTTADRYTYGDIKENIVKELDNYWREIYHYVDDQIKAIDEMWNDSVERAKEIVDEKDYVLIKHKIFSFNRFLEDDEDEFI